MNTPVRMASIGAGAARDSMNGQGQEVFTTNAIDGRLNVSAKETLPEQGLISH